MGRRSSQLQNGSNFFTNLFVPAADVSEYVQSIFYLIERRAYEIFKTRGGSHGRDVEDWLQAESEVLRPVASELDDDGDRFIAIVRVGNSGPEKLKISVEPECLRIWRLPESRAEMISEATTEEAHMRPFLVCFQLPAKIRTTAVTVNVTEGLLKVFLPKGSTSRLCYAGNERHPNQIADQSPQIGAES